MATVLTTTYSSSTAITFDLSSLAPSSSFVAGRESTEIDNTSTKYVDAIVNVYAITGHASTAPSIGQMIVLYAWGAEQAASYAYIDALDGADSNETITVEFLQALRFVAAPSVIATTAGLKYYIQPFSVAQLFGGVMPKYWGLFAAHNHTGALSASNSGLFYFSGITYTST